jgi:endoglucanase
VGGVPPVILTPPRSTTSNPVRNVVMAALVVLGAGALFSLGACGSTSSSSTARVARSPDARAQAAARRFLARYVTPDGRVSQIDEGGDTVGEGQAYGMLMSAAIGDPERFDAIWGWTKSHLRRPDGLISFLWKGGRVVDSGAAADADLDASRALLVAACRFHRPSLRQEGVDLAGAILRSEVATVDGTPVLTAGSWAVNPPVTLNPSYFSPATYAALSSASHNGQWDRLATSSRSITAKLMPGPGRLPPDWAQLHGANPVAIGKPGSAHTPPQFGFDAVRTLVRMAEDPNAIGRDIAARAWPVFAGQDPSRIPVEHDPSGRPTGTTLHPVVLVSAAGAADAAEHPGARDGLLDAAEALDRRSPSYYGGAWVALGRIMLTTHLLTSCV